MIWADLLLELVLHLGPPPLQEERKCGVSPLNPCDESRASSDPELTSSQNFRMCLEPGSLQM